MNVQRVKLAPRMVVPTAATKRVTIAEENASIVSLGGAVSLWGLRFTVEFVLQPTAGAEFNAFGLGARNNHLQ